jgi:hypothetical protein
VKAYDSVTKAAFHAVVSALGATVLWLLAVPVAEGWINEWSQQPTGETIQLWKRLLVEFADGWPIIWPAFVVFVWVMSFLIIELLRRLKPKHP